MLFEPGKETEQCIALLKNLTGKNYTAEEASKLYKQFAHFEQFVIDAGGSLIQPEQWAVMAYIAWCGEGFTLFRKEAQHVKALKRLVLAQGNTFTMTTEFRDQLQALIQHWMEEG